MPSPNKMVCRADAHGGQNGNERRALGRTVNLRRYLNPETARDAADRCENGRPMKEGNEHAPSISYDI